MSVPRPIRNAAPLLCYVTDRRQLRVSADGQEANLLGKIREAAEAGIDWIQIREKDLPAAASCRLAREAIRCLPAPCRILINDRLDVAWATSAGGVHLGEGSVPVEEARRFLGRRGAARAFLIGASVHSVAAARAAEAAGADYVIFGPVFATPSKAASGVPQGLARLAEVCDVVAVPVLAIGGVTPENAGDCYGGGASGVAGIRLFQGAPDLPAMVQRLRGKFE